MADVSVSWISGEGQQGASSDQRLPADSFSQALLMERRLRPPTTKHISHSLQINGTSVMHVSSLECKKIERQKKL